MRAISTWIQRSKIDGEFVSFAAFVFRDLEVLEVHPVLVAAAAGGDDLSVDLEPDPDLLAVCPAAHVEAQVSALEPET